jgi:Fe-S cluster assembly iron-binding protein IscA
VRVELKNSGCCDASLGLRTSTFSENDLTMESEGLTFIIARETYELTGEVTISYINQSGKKGFVLTSSQLLNEWDGFAVTAIEI